MTMIDCSGGNGQTLMSKYREWKYGRGTFKYDVREICKLPDGGTLHIDCKGPGFLEGAQAVNRPLVMMVVGLMQRSTEPTVKIIV